MTGEYVREKLSKSGYQLADIARTLNISPQNLQSKLNAKDFRVSFLFSLAKAINKNVYYFFGDEYDNVRRGKIKPFITTEEETKNTENLTLKTSKEKGKVFDTKPKVQNKELIETAETLYTKDKEPKKNDDIKTFSLMTDHTMQNQRVPLYNIEATAGLVSLFAGAHNQEPTDYIQIPNLPPCDGALHVTGDSMYPILKSGDIVLYKQINDIINNIFWGEMYLISIDTDGEEFITLKFLQKSEQGKQYVKLVSQNQHHQPRDIRIDRIRALAFVKASVRMNSMG